MENQNLSKADLIFNTFNELDEEDKNKVVENIQNSTSSRKRKRTVFEEDFKEKAVNIWKENGNYLMTADELNKGNEGQKVHESYIRRWASEKLAKEEIVQVKKKIKLTKPKVAYPEMEEMLRNWFKIQRENNLAITMKQFKDKALELFKELKLKYEATHNIALESYSKGSFKASNGWFRRFRKRSKISKRIATHVSSKLAENYTSQIATFIGRVRELR